jgi:hypothetical protein
VPGGLVVGLDRNFRTVVPAQAGTHSTWAASFSSMLKWHGFPPPRTSVRNILLD